MKRTPVIILALGLVSSSVWAQNTPGFNQKIPEKIMTPDKVETRIGTLNFVDGVPTVETTQKVYDNLDFLRGVEVFLNFIPAASMEGLRLAQVERGATERDRTLRAELDSQRAKVKMEQQEKAYER